MAGAVLRVPPPRRRTTLASGPLRLTAAALTLAVVGLVAGCSDRPGAPGDALEANATVTRIVDGDTIVVRIDGVEERVRLIGIDTPESVDPRRPVMCFGQEASDHMASLLPPGTAVRLERDVEPRDRYDRLLAYVHRASDGMFVNLAMVTDGFADQSTYPPNVAHTAELRAAVASARAEGRGLWSACERPFEQ